MTTMTTADTDLELRDLRRWHLGGGTATPLAAGALPALLAPFGDPARVRHDYPLVLAPTADGPWVRPIGEALSDWATHAGSGRVLQDNLQRLEQQLRELLAEDAGADGRERLLAAAERMVAAMGAGEQTAAGLRADLAAMLQQAAEVELLPLDGSTALRLFVAAARRRVVAARRRFDDEVQRYAALLRQLIAVEQQKGSAAAGSEAMARSLGGGAARFLDPKTLARSVGARRGSAPPDPQRVQRLQRALATLEQHLAAEPSPEVVTVEREDDVCAAAVRRFDEFASALTATVRAASVAEVESRGAYEPARHDPLLSALGWRDLGADELHTLPVVIAVAPAAEIGGSRLQSLTGLLTSRRPVQVLVQELPAHDPLADASQRSGALRSGPRLELGYLGIALREAFVQQSTAARPQHLLRGFECALGGIRPGLHVVDSGLDASGREPALGAFLHAGAAIEGRAHPLFRYDPEAGDTWAQRLDFTHNPAPDADWPRSDRAVPGGAGDRRELAFTFADYALLEPHLRDCFAGVPEAVVDSGELVELVDYLQLPADEARHRVPFVWFARAGGAEALQRAAIRRSLVDCCRDRLGFWRTLQELAGVRNEHVREAVQRARQEAADAAAREREELAARYERDLEQVRAQAVAAAMQGLARRLLDVDTVPGPSAVSEPAPVPAPEAPPAAAAAPEAPPAAVADLAEEPWIESARCSSCNDCIDINSLLFVYDENKQARIGDPRAGTYKQLVQAAEKCPSRCIHPGRPLNPDEPGLEKLIARAAPFN